MQKLRSRIYVSSLLSLFIAAYATGERGGRVGAVVSRKAAGRLWPALLTLRRSVTDSVSRRARPHARALPPDAARVVIR